MTTTAETPGFSGAVKVARREMKVDKKWALELMEKHHSFVWRLLVRLGLPGSDAEDATQQVFFVVFSKQDLRLETTQERGYLYGVASRVAFEFFRKNKKHASDASEPDEYLGPLVSMEDLVDQRRARELLDRILLTLPFHYRQVLVLSELDGFSKSEIARTLDLPEGTVASRLRRAKRIFEEKVKRATGTRTGTS